MVPRFDVACILAVGMSVLVGATGCRRTAEDREAKIDYKPLVEDKPDVDPPRIYFPADCQPKDPALTSFIERVLKVCEQGDYDPFCGLLATTEVAPSYDDFQRIWQGVREITVKSVRSAETDPPQYFVHAVAKFREPDARNREERDVVIRIFKEMDQWRIAGAPKDIRRQILLADTQPASAPAAVGRPGREAVSTAPANGSSVYKSEAKANGS
ncbi:MAG: hypothetical protein HY718_13355 [Planctomycetes bacterium]|nr:hypothetical protein [Planctomycetota bacterium]